MRDQSVVINLAVTFLMVASIAAGAFAQDGPASEALAFDPFELTSVGGDGDVQDDKAAKKALKAEQKAQEKAIRKAMKMMLLGAKRRAYPSVISHRPGLRSPMRPPL